MTKKNIFKQYSVLKFLSSVKMAVPLMVIILVAIAIGTLLESRYNAQYAQLVIYGAWWFIILLSLLWLNIFCSTLSRIPFKKSHVGFVITHIGLLTLLIGALVTSFYGIDGQLRIAEAEQENRIVLPELVLETFLASNEVPGPGAQPAGLKTLTMPRFLVSKDQDDLNSLNQELKFFHLKKFLPFATRSEGYETNQEGSAQGNHSFAVEFNLKNSFFDVTEWLDSQEKSSMQMGPALLKMTPQSQVADADISAPKEIKQKNKTKTKDAKEKNPGSEQDHIVLTAENGTEQKISLKDLKKAPQVFLGFKVTLVHYFQKAIVGDGGITNNGEQNNPAVELLIEKDNQKVREIRFSKFPDFSMHQSNPIPFKIVFNQSGQSKDVAPASVNTEHAHHQAALNVDSNEPANVIEFIYPDSENSKPVVVVRLTKNKEKVLEKELKVGDQLETPWMAMTISIKNIVPQASKNSGVKSIELPERSPLPSSAVLVSNFDETLQEWFLEGDEKMVNVAGTSWQVYYGPKIAVLPFKVKLHKFKKTDYFGTDRPKEFSSLVSINDSAPALISMNEPLKQDGYTLYQSSYELNPNGPAISIFSVNKDPGRPIKYVGSLFLSLGIILFTLMRSKRFMDLIGRMTQSSQLRS